MTRFWHVTIRRLWRFAGVALLLSACATPTPYQPAVDGEGFGEQKLAPGRYRVWFAGNTVTPRATVENYLLYRAAEVTVETGHRWFRLIDQDTEAETTYYTTLTGFPAAAFAPFPSVSRPMGPAFFEATSRPVSRYEAFAVISLHADDRPAQDERAYDAAAVLAALGPTIIRPPAPTR
jgi:hypothetical protein